MVNNSKRMAIIIIMSFVKMELKRTIVSLRVIVDFFKILSRIAIKLLIIKCVCKKKNITAILRVSGCFARVQRVCEVF